MTIRTSKTKPATESLAKWSSEKEESLIPAKTREQFTRVKEEDRIDPNEPIFTHLTIGPKTGKKGRVSVDHDKYLYSRP